MLTDSRRPLPKVELNIAVIGETGAGKSALMSRLINPQVELNKDGYSYVQSTSIQHQHKGKDKKLDCQLTLQITDISATNNNAASNADIFIMTLDAKKPINELETEMQKICDHYKKQSSRDVIFSCVFTHFDELTKEEQSKKIEQIIKVKFKEIFKEQSGAFVYCYGAIKNEIIYPQKNNVEGNQALKIIHDAAAELLQSDQALQNKIKSANENKSLETIIRSSSPIQNIGNSVTKILKDIKDNEKTLWKQYSEKPQSKRSRSDNAELEKHRLNIDWLTYFIKRIATATQDQQFNLAVLNQFLKDVLSKDFKCIQIQGGKYKNTLIATGFFDSDTEKAIKPIIKLVDSLKADGQDSATQNGIASKVAEHVNNFKI